MSAGKTVARIQRKSAPLKKINMKQICLLSFCLLASLTVISNVAIAGNNINDNMAPLSASNVSDVSSSQDKRFTIVSLAPHLTEWVYSLGLEANLVAVSEYSDFPEAAKKLPRIANYQGADIAAIVALEPNLVLAWEGGNKPQDVQKLADMGLNVFNSKISEITDIPSEIVRLGSITGKHKLAIELAATFEQQLSTLYTKYRRDHLQKVFYYSWTAPLMSVGTNAWANKLLKVCGAQTLFDDSPVDYPQVSIKDVLTRQPDALVAASKRPHDELEAYWTPHRQFLTARLVVVNPDVTSRFSLRLTGELALLCDGINK